MSNQFKLKGNWYEANELGKYTPTFSNSATLLG